MPSVWEPRFAELVKALAALRESTSLELLPDVMPVLNVLEDGPEYGFQRGERYHSSYVWVAAGGAGTYSGFRIRNQSTSGSLVVVNQMQALMGAAQNVLAYIVSGVADLALNQDHPALDGRDGRYPGAVGGAGAATAAVLSYGAAATVYTNTNTVRVGYGAANANFDLLVSPLVLPPGWSAGFIGSSANTALGGTIWWEERSVGRDELVVK
jgi:hypothetical protein